MDEVGRYLIGLARRGDDGAIGPMMEAASCSDPAMGDVLSAYLRELLVRQPKRFVTALLGREDEVARDAVYLATSRGGTDIEQADLAHLKAVLEGMSRGRGRIALMARRCLIEVKRDTGDTR